MFLLGAAGTLNACLVTGVDTNCDLLSVFLTTCVAREFLRGLVGDD